MTWAQGESAGWESQGSGLRLSSGCPPPLNGSDSLDGNVPKVVPKVAGSGGCPQPRGAINSLFLFTPPESGAAVGAGREGGSGRQGRVRGQQQLYGWPSECEVKGTSMLLPGSPMLCLTGSSHDELD